MTHGSHRQVNLPITDEEIEKESDSEFFFPRIATLLKQKLHLPLAASGSKGMPISVSDEFFDLAQVFNLTHFY